MVGKCFLLSRSGVRHKSSGQTIWTAQRPEQSEGEGQGRPESISPGAPLNQQVIGPSWAADFPCRHYVGSKYPKLPLSFVQILHVAYMNRLRCFAQQYFSHTGL